MSSQIKSKKEPNSNAKLEVKQTQTLITSSPIPPPDFMRAYAEIDPSLPDRILKLAEDNLNHQYKHQNKIDILQFLGWGSATLITLVAMGLGTYLLMNDKDLAGFSFLLGSALPSIIIYFTSRAKQRQIDK